MSLSTAFLEHGISWAQFSTGVTQIHGPSMYLLSTEQVDNKSLGELRKAWTSCACCDGNTKLSHPFALVVSLLTKSEEVYRPTQQLLTRLLLWNCVTTWQSPTETHNPPPQKKRVGGLPTYLNGKESVCHCGRCRFHPWVRKIPWRRKWQPTPGFLSGEFHGQRSLVGYSPWRHRDRHHWVTNTFTHFSPFIETWTHSLIIRSAYLCLDFLRFKSFVSQCRKNLVRHKEIGKKRIYLEETHSTDTVWGHLRRREIGHGLFLWTG